MKAVVAVFVAGMLVCRHAVGDEIRLASGEVIKNCKVARLPDGRYEIRISPKGVIRLGEKEVEPQSLVRGETTWKDDDKPNPPPDSGTEPKPAPDSRPEEGQKKLDAFSAALAKYKALAAVLREKRLAVEGDGVWQLAECSSCKGKGKVTRTSSKLVTCPVCDGRRASLTIDGRIATCRRCDGRGTVHGTETEECHACDGTGLDRRDRKGRLNDMVLLVPELKNYVDARAGMTGAALDVLAEPELRSMPEDVFLTAALLLGRGWKNREPWLPNERQRIPADKGLLLAVVHVAATNVVGQNTTVVIKAWRHSTPFEDAREFRAIIHAPGKLKLRADERFLIRGFISRKEDDLCVVEDYRIYPDVFKETAKRE